MAEGVEKARSGDPDPEVKLTSAAGYIGLLPNKVETDQKALSRDLRHSGHTTLAWASGATLIILPAVSSWRRRRGAAASDIVRLARQFTARRPRSHRSVHVVLTFIGYTLLWLGIFAGGAAVKMVHLPLVARGVALVSGLITIPTGRSAS